ncbi:MAG TPA: tRNA preQ1(34) S-adenosylmethionine ribosyltransferase-isomerase QueA [Rhizomicrobium sp.]|jgi:S-adenosylmethionine:tRNA ribosyltransferase-isomerase|nr:tRNA preQ1(34) S-adenosylmethionine ribosyltransferase-isomerase QueA [Rhizomicrobium sp.]
MDVSLFDFELPEERIALRPAHPRDSARMLVVHQDGELEHARVRDLPYFLRSGDVVVVNDTKVISARLYGRRLPRIGNEGEGAKIELMLHKRVSADRFLAFARPAKKLVSGDRVQISEALSAIVVARRDGGGVEVEFGRSGSDLDSAIASHGEIPLPPYIAGKRKVDGRDTKDYQTIFAAHRGSVAAPTAGLHFTPELFTRLEQNGVARETVTLHVGAGTFLPVTADDTDQHRMHAEWATVPGSTAARLNQVRDSGGRIVAVGTTSLRTLETAARKDNTLAPFAGETALFITPGYRFKSAEILLTNFHLPRSTLFMLVCAFSGIESMKRVYAEAIREDYRFYSYGDACLLFR